MSEVRARAMKVVEDLGIQSLPEKMRIASAIEKEMASLLNSVALDLESLSIRSCREEAMERVRDFARRQTAPLSGPRWGTGS